MYIDVDHGFFGSSAVNVKMISVEKMASKHRRRHGAYTKQACMAFGDTYAPLAPHHLSLQLTIF